MLGANGLRTLVSRLSIEQGYLYVNEATFENVPFTVEDYTNAIMEAEGLTPRVGGDVWRETRRLVDEVFEMYDTTD